MKGKTVSITIPMPLLKDYEEQAKRLGISRSKVITTILMNEYTQRKSLTSADKEKLKQEGE